ncbi:hypothetical protein HWV62_37731 [Athelia sp. TMB]|nr:hypothetical protein HWV62_37731 [Athelia sp. TMB]
MSSSSDPRAPIHKPRTPKTYTDAQLAFLKSHLPCVLAVVELTARWAERLIPYLPTREFERKTQGSVRGDAKKFALERAGEFINNFGLPEELEGVTEPEPRFKEQIYNWYKNTVGRTRRRQEGRPRTSKKSDEPSPASTQFTWPTNLATPTTVPYTETNAPINMAKPAEPIQPIPAPSPQFVVSYQPSMQSVASTSRSPPGMGHSIDTSAMRDGFLNHALDVPSLSNMMQAFAMSKPTPTPLSPVVDALFEAISIAQSSRPQHTGGDHTSNDPSYQLLRRFAEACAYFPPSIIHANIAGSMAGPRAMQMAIRKASVWQPLGSLMATSAASQGSMSHEMERMNFDRQRRKDYIQWARVHAAAIELGMLGISVDPNPSQMFSGRSFSEGMARDSVWQEDEVEWCAGIFVLRAIIRMGIRSGSGSRGEYEELLRIYESRWKEIKDETRQALFAEVLLGAKDDLAHLDEQRT